MTWDGVGAFGHCSSFSTFYIPPSQQISSLSKKRAIPWQILRTCPTPVGQGCTRHQRKTKPLSTLVPLLNTRRTLVLQALTINLRTLRLAVHLDAVCDTGFLILRKEGHLDAGNPHHQPVVNEPRLVWRCSHWRPTYLLRLFRRDESKEGICDLLFGPGLPSCRPPHRDVRYIRFVGRRQIPSIGDKESNDHHQCSK